MAGKSARPTELCGNFVTLRNVYLTGRLPFVYTRTSFTTSPRPWTCLAWRCALANLRSLRRLTALLVILAAVLILLPATASASPPTEKDRLLFDLRTAQQYEENHDWENAYKTYTDVLSRARNQTQARERLPFVLRNLHRRIRLKDASYRYQLSLLKWPKEALEFYKDVLLKVQDSYPNLARKDLNRLFREGLVELRLALGDKQFCEAHLGSMAANPMQVLMFIEYLRARERDITPIASRDQTRGRSAEGGSACGQGASAERAGGRGRDGLRRL